MADLSPRVAVDTGRGEENERQKGAPRWLLLSVQVKQAGGGDWLSALPNT